MNDNFYLQQTRSEKLQVVDPATSLAIAPDSTPIVSVFEDGSTSAMAYLPAVSPDGGIGLYTVTIVATPANGFEPGKSYSFRAVAIIAAASYPYVLANLIALCPCDTLYNGIIHVDLDSGISGTIVGGQGTAGTPVDNMTDAFAINALLGSPNLFHLKDAAGAPYSLPSDLSGIAVLGTTGRPQLNLQNRVIGLSRMENLKLTGNVNGILTAHFCHLAGLANVEGQYYDCVLDGDITLGGNTLFMHCASNVAGIATPSVDFLLAGSIDFQVRGFQGGMEIEQMAAGDIMSFDAPGGRIIFNTNCTGGLAKVTYPSEYTDNSSGRVTIVYIHPDAIHQGQLRTGGDGTSTVQLAASAPGQVSGMDPSLWKFSKGTIIQEEICNQYDIITKIGIMRRGLKTAVDDTWQCEVFPSVAFGHLNDGQTQAGGTTTSAILNALASIVTNAYKDQTFVVTNNSTLEDFKRIVVSSGDDGSGNCEIVWSDPLPISVGSGVHYEMQGCGNAERFLVSATYTVAGNPLVYTFSSGEVWTHTYDGNDKLISITPS